MKSHRFHLATLLIAFVTISSAPAKIPGAEVTSDYAAHDENETRRVVIYQPLSNEKAQRVFELRNENDTKIVKACTHRNFIVKYVRKHGLPEDMWKELSDRCDLRDRNTVKRLLLGCRHRYAILSGDRSVSNDPASMLSKKSKVFSGEKLAKKWSLYLIDDTASDGTRNEKDPLVYRVLDEETRIEFLADSFRLAFDRWLSSYSKIVPAATLELVSYETMVNGFATVYDIAKRWNVSDKNERYARWCRRDFFEKLVSSSRFVLDLDIGVSNRSGERLTIPSPASVNILSTVSDDNRSIRLNNRAKWYVRLSDSSEPLRSLMVDIIRKSYIHPNSSYIGLPFSSSEWHSSPRSSVIDEDIDATLHHGFKDAVYSLHAIALLRLQNYFGFSPVDASYPADLSESAATRNKHYPSYTTLGSRVERCVENLYDKIASWIDLPRSTILLAENISSRRNESVESLAESLLIEMVKIRKIIDRGAKLLRDRTDDTNA